MRDFSINFQVNFTLSPVYALVTELDGHFLGFELHLIIELRLLVLNSDWSRTVRHSAKANEDDCDHKHKKRDNCDSPLQRQKLELRVKNNSFRKIGYHKGLSRNLSGGILSGFGA